MITLTFTQLFLCVLGIVGYTLLVAHTMLTFDDHLWSPIPETRLEKAIRVLGTGLSIPGVFFVLIVAMIIALPFELYYKVTER